MYAEKVKEIFKDCILLASKNRMSYEDGLKGVMLRTRTEGQTDLKSEIVV